MIFFFENDNRIGACTTYCAPCAEHPTHHKCVEQRQTTQTILQIKNKFYTPSAYCTTTSFTFYLQQTELSISFYFRQKKKERKKESAESTQSLLLALRTECLYYFDECVFTFIFKTVLIMHSNPFRIEFFNLTC